MKPKTIGSTGILTTLSISTMAAKKKLPSLSPALTDEVLRFIEYHPAKRFDKNLRKLLIEFLQFDGAMEAGYLDDLLYDLEGLYTLLDAIQAEAEIKS